MEVFISYISNGGVANREVREFNFSNFSNFPNFFK